MAWFIVLVAIVVLFTLKSAALWTIALPMLGVVISVLTLRTLWRLLRGSND